MKEEEEEEEEEGEEGEGREEGGRRRIYRCLAWRLPSDREEG